MFANRIRTTAVTIVAALSFAGASLVPAAAQAQWHTYCVAGHCITHTNFTLGGTNPCTTVNSNYNKAYETLLEAIQNKKEQADKVHPEMTQAEAQAEIEADEAQVHLASIAAFEWGCDVAAMHTSPTTGVKSIAGVRSKSFTAMAIRKGGPLGPGPLHLVHPVMTIALQAGSAGVSGYDDGKCESLANDYNKAVDELEQGVLHNDEHRANYYGELANRIYGQMSDNCLVVYS